MSLAESRNSTIITPWGYRDFANLSAHPDIYFTIHPNIYFVGNEFGRVT